MHNFETVGIMVDLSRNAVMTLDGWNRFLPIISKMGYNAVFLYMEDTYEVEDEPYFGYMRGRYSINEMKALDALGEKYGVEMIPCIQTLAHLEPISKWNIYPNDTSDILLVGDERTYDLIRNMFKTLKKCFKTRRIHVGMDEAHMLGKGNYLDRNGYKNQGDIIREHLARVAQIAEEYGYEALMWSDMFFRGWNGGDYYMRENGVIPDEYKNALPESFVPVYWDYYMKSETRYDLMLNIHRQLSDKTMFAGGLWTWLGPSPDNIHSVETMLPAIRMCKKHGIKNVFFTMWGNDGGECSRFSMLPALYYIAEYIRGNEDEAKIKAGFGAEFGISYDDFTLLDLPNYVGRFGSPWATNPVKYGLYSDCFQGFLDYLVTEGGDAEYKEYAVKLAAVESRAGEYSYLFKVSRLLCEILSLKYELGVKTRSAYKSGDKAELLRLINENYALIPDLVSELYEAFRDQWHRENKRFGFEVQDYRFGGLIARIKTQMGILLDYVEGRIDSIEELEGDILKYLNREAGKSMYFNCHHQNISSNYVKFG